MTQTIDPYARSAGSTWPAPAQGTAPTPTRGKSPWLFIGIFFAAVAVVAVAQASHDTTKSDGGGHFSVAAGWTISRAADLAVRIQADDGATKATADCAMKMIAGHLTWSEWHSWPPVDQQTAISVAREDC